MEPEDVPEEDHIVILKEGFMHRYEMELTRSLDGRWMAKVEREIGPLTTKVPEYPIEETQVKRMVDNDDYEVFKNGR